ncbi:OTU domain-containing protein OS=Streptomyces fumanus OX=67302 GN=GCM10018772_56770 PE=4 SV=1 [Streptomyces fumanus]
MQALGGVLGRPAGIGTDLQLKAHRRRAEAEQNVATWAATVAAARTVLGFLEPGSAALVQVDAMTEWMRLSATDKRRSTALKAVDRAVESAVSRGEVTALRNVLDQVEQWRATKSGPSVRDTAVRDLTHDVLNRLARLTAPVPAAARTPFVGMADTGDAMANGLRRALDDLRGRDGASDTVVRLAGALRTYGPPWTPRGPPPLPAHP